MWKANSSSDHKWYFYFISQPCVEDQSLEKAFLYKATVDKVVSETDVIAEVNETKWSTVLCNFIWLFFNSLWRKVLFLGGGQKDI